MSVDLNINNGCIVTPTGTMRAGIAVDKGKVIAIAEESLLPPANETIDASDKYVLPGLIDAHTHLCYAVPFGERLTTDTQSLAAGGVTTFGHFIRSTSQSALDMLDNHIESLEKYSLIDGFFHAVIVGEFLDDIPELLKKGINSFKFWLGYKGEVGPKGEPRGKIDDGILFDAFASISKLDLPAWAMVHAENAEIAAVLRKRLEEAGRKDFPAWDESRPYFTESESMRKAIYFAQITNCPLYVVHMSISEGVDLIAKAKADGINVVAETCLHYLTHSNDEPVPLLKKHPTLGVVNPPIRDKKSNEKLWQGIKDGWVSTVGSDYATWTLSEKGEDIWHTNLGIGAGAEMILPVMLSEGVNKRGLSLEKVVEVCCYNPAKIFGRFPEKGAIAIGSDADLVIIDLHKKVKVTTELLHTPSNVCDWTIYDDWEMEGWPVLTLLRGEIVVKDGEIVGKPGRARWLPSKPAKGYCRLQ